MALDDIERVHKIDKLSFSLPWPISAFRYELTQNKASMLWVAEIGLPDGEALVIGSIVVWMILDEAHIATISVHPDYRGRGISQRILVVALRGAISRGARYATLEVRANNLIAQALYRRFRFDVTGTRPRYYQDNKEDALIMTVDLHQRVEGGVSYLDWLESNKWERKFNKSQNIQYQPRR